MTASRAFRPLAVPALLLVLAALAGCATPADPTPHKGAHAPAATPSATGDMSPYVPLVHSPIRGLTPEQIDAYATGKGASMALPAELNGYPGPAHVLELAEPLELTAQQREAMELLRDEMRASAVARGEELLALHKALDDGFRNGTLDEASLGRLLEDIARADARLRFVHLRTHFDAAELLTPHQRALYVEMRGYGRGDHASHSH